MIFISSWKFRTYLIIFLVGIFNLVYNASLPLHFDEAYYWMMSRYPAAGYFDIPPMLAYLIALTGLFGEDVWLIRMVAVLCGMATAIFVFMLSREIYGERIAFWTVLFFLALPMVQLGFTITTTDAPLMFFWAATAYFGYMAIFNGAWKYWVLLGLCMGFALLSKYTAVLLGFSIFSYVIFWRNDLLKELKSWMAVILAFLVFFPVLYWNWALEWAPFKFRYEYGSGSVSDFSFYYMAEFLFGAILIFSPVLFVLFFVALINRRNSLRSEERYLLMVTFTVLAFFAYKGLFNGMAPNWYTPAILTALPFIVNYMISLNHKKIAFSAFAVSIMISLLVTYPNLFKLTHHANIHSRLMGYHEAVYELEERAGDESIICANYYSMASLINYLLPEYRDRVLILNDRISDYDFFPQPEIYGESCYYLTEQEYDSAGSNFCDTMKLVSVYEYRHPTYTDRDWYIYRCKGINMEMINNKTAMW